MTKRGDYSIKGIYQGGASSFDYDKGDNFTGYRLPSGNLGAPTKPDTANQIQQANMLLNQGIIPIEVGALSPEVFDQIPKQHFEEMRRMAKLGGGKISVHAPLIEPSGIGEQGWNETNRELAEKQLMGVIDKSVALDDNGQIPITIHSAGIPGSEYIKTKEGKKIHKLVVIDQESGKPTALEPEKKFYPGSDNLKDGEIKTPQKELESLNHSSWDNSLSQVVFYKEGADRILAENAPLLRHLNKELAGKDKEEVKEAVRKFPVLGEALGHVQNAQVYLQNTQQYLSGLFNKAYKFGNPHDKKILEEASERFKKDLEKGQDVEGQSRAIQGLMEDLNKVQPNLYVPIEEFALEKSSETFANVAFHAYDKHKDKAPVVSIENLYPGMAFSMKKEKDGVPGMRDLIMESKKKFVEKAKAKGYSESVAKTQADKLIGMTLDVGHLNIAKKKGFKDADLVKEVEDIAKFVKHVHLTDNFGYSDSHLPPGMGNVPFKKHMEVLEKAGVLEKARTVVEAGGWVQHFGTSPLPHTLEGFGSPYFKKGDSAYWNQSPGLYQDYYGGYGLMLPEGNFQTYGAGFSALPTELGGARPGAQGSRMSGNAME